MKPIGVLLTRGWNTVFDFVLTSGTSLCEKTMTYLDIVYSCTPSGRVLVQSGAKNLKWESLKWVRTLSVVHMIGP